MQKVALALAMVAGTLGCRCQRACPHEAAVTVASSKDPLSSATSADADDDDEVAIELQDGASFDQELRDLQAAEPEKFMFNSAEGAQDGVVLGVLAAHETMDEALTRLRRDPRVRVAEPVVSVHADYVPNDPQYTMQWNLKQIHMEKAWDVASRIVVRARPLSSSPPIASRQASLTAESRYERAAPSRASHLAI